MHSHPQAPASMKGKTAKEVAREIENADPLKVGEPGPSHPSLHSRTKRTTDCISNSHMIALALNLGCAQTELAPNHPINQSLTLRYETRDYPLPPTLAGRGQAGRVDSLPNRRGGMRDRATAHR